ncbi:uncharacterized protein EI97DRAFT_398148 [Westerdykella ornata]|uniref:SRP9 domain-containing protein n=1 Tax=Westerdykella ornata TaxID=318751 RepID=A0A6A6JID7_WESOR|nr:uncharacterized protein EI97DRAFT_398148 [Westerdykella ornata]KAF2276410.1 hypothetical protein EI97DRAFT_398148 [Westerdykella ornata]
MYFTSSTEWYEQASLLLKARPSTARITSKYTVLKPTSSKIRKRQKYASKRAHSTSAGDAGNPTTTPQPPAEQDAQAPSATFTLKAYDPVSGCCLKYETNKAAEVGRLIASLGRLGKHMAAMKEVTTDFSVPAGNAGIETPAGGDSDVPMVDVGAKGESRGDVPQKAATGGGGGKKKKKGKK